MLKLDEIIEKLELEPLEGEGGMWVRAYQSDEFIGANTFDGRITDRPICNTIYFLLTPNSFSHMHKLVSDEIWYYHMGPSLKMLLVYPDGTSEIKVLGPKIDKGELPQITVRRGTYQGAKMKSKGEYTLVSTSESPAYQDVDYTIGTYDELKKLVKDRKCRKLLKELTGEIKFR